MSIQITIEPDPRNPKVNIFKRAQKGMARAMRKQVGEILTATERAVKQSVRGSFDSGAPELARSYSRKFKTSGGSKGAVIEASVTSRLVYAKVQDLGTSYLPEEAIRAKPPLKHLAVPIQKRLKKAGIWPRHYEESGQGRLFKLDRSGKDSLLMDTETGEPQYVLVKETSFKGKQYIAKAIKAVESKRFRILGRVYRMAISKGSR